MHPTIQQQQDEFNQIKYSNYASYKQKKADAWFIQQSCIKWQLKQLETGLSKDKLAQHQSKVKQLQTWRQQPDDAFFKTVPEFIIYLGTLPSRDCFCEFLISVGKQHLITLVPKY